LYAENVIVPRLDVLEEYYNFQLVPKFPDSEGLLLLYVSPVPADKEAELKAGEIAPWSMSLNEWRARQGLGPKPDGDDLYMLPSGNALVTLDQAQDPNRQNAAAGSNGNGKANGRAEVIIVDGNNYYLSRPES
jgi:hypothetical protein